MVFTFPVPLPPGIGATRVRLPRSAGMPAVVSSEHTSKVETSWLFHASAVWRIKHRLDGQFWPLPISLGANLHARAGPISGSGQPPSQTAREILVPAPRGGFPEGLQAVLRLHKLSQAQLGQPGQRGQHRDGDYPWKASDLHCACQGHAV